jgi:hypothetical protein
VFSDDYWFNLNVSMNRETQKFSAKIHVNPRSDITVGYYGRCVVCRKCNLDYCAIICSF